MIQEEHLSVIKWLTDYICKIYHNCKYPDTALIFGQSWFNKKKLKKLTLRDLSGYVKLSQAREKSKMLMQADNNGLGHFSYVKELEDICPPEVVLVSQTIPCL